MSKLIQQIMSGEGIEDIFNSVLCRIYGDGPVLATDMETLSYISIFQPQFFNSRINETLTYLGLFYKKGIKSDNLATFMFQCFREQIKDDLNGYFTPVQASIIDSVRNNHAFSFSAPTSTGKSFAIRKIITESKGDVVVVVPSRALINEYYQELCSLIKDKSINILTFIDKINTASCERTIFVVTPERCRELFKRKDDFNIEYVIFDEAQLTDENSKRSLWYDSVVRRFHNHYPLAKMMFAHPFVSNPECQLQKNHLEGKDATSIKYVQRNVGQIFISKDDQGFAYFSIDPASKGQRKVRIEEDPIEQAILQGKTVLFYVSKNSILNNSILIKFARYIDLCGDIKDENALEIINELKSYTGGETIANMNFYSQMLAMMKRGIVIHHGSLPLEARLMIENFTNAGHCRICFCTATLEQGINMPFDLVYIDRLESSDELGVKNLIGRAGRSTVFPKFDIGRIVVDEGNVSRLKKLFSDEIVLKENSLLDNSGDLGDSEMNELRDAFNDGTFDDNYSLTQSQLLKLQSQDSETTIAMLLDAFFVDDDIVGDDIIYDWKRRGPLFNCFRDLYAIYLGRGLSEGEDNVIKTALEILIWRVHGKIFSQICHNRYAYASRQSERAKAAAAGYRVDKIMARGVQMFCELPNPRLPKFIPLIPQYTPAKDVNYDTITYDTYDYLDKLIGLYLSDIYYAAFMKYYENHQDERAAKFAKLVKFGTYDEKEILMLRYGLSFDDIVALKEYITYIGEDRIEVASSFVDLPDNLKAPLMRYI